MGEQPGGVAQAAPYLYFSVVALDAIEGLFSERTRLLALLNEEQQRLARALQLRWDLTQTYWSTIASFGGGRWPVEDIPWRTTDGLESDYFSLLVTAVTAQDLANRRATDSDLARVGDLLAELANRARITRRPYADDDALTMHYPGVELHLVGSEELGPARLAWLAADFSPLLMKRTLRIAEMMHDPERRGQLLRFVDTIWDHLSRRRLRDGAARDLWDQPAGVYGQLPVQDEAASWYYTERVVESLTAAARLVSRPPLKSERASGIADDLLTEAEHLYDQELLSGSGEAGPAMRRVLHTMRLSLERARSIRTTRPATAVALISEVLRDLDGLAAARRDAQTP
nr:SCO2524 family protein [Phytohabitans flavus]